METVNNVAPLHAPRHDLQELVQQIKAVLYQRSGRISVIEAIGALEIVKHEVMQEQ